MSESAQLVLVPDLKPFIGQKITLGDRTGQLVGVRRTGRDPRDHYEIRFEDDPDAPLLVPPSVSAVLH